MSDVAMFDAHPTVAVQAESPLAMSRITVATQAAAQGAGVCIRERALLGHLILRGKAADEGFRAGVEAALGVPLPLAMGTVSRDAERGVSVQWISPDEWLVVVPEGEAQDDTPIQFGNEPKDEAAKPADDAIPAIPEDDAVKALEKALQGDKK